MSNRSIINRIENRVRELEADPGLASEFPKFLDESIEALEGVPYSLITEMREHRYRLEIAGFAEKENCISDLSEVVRNLKTWIEKIKQDFC